MRKSQRGLLEWDRRRTTKDVRAEGRVTGWATPIIGHTLSVLRVVSTTHTSTTSEATTSNVMTSERGRGHTCARLSIIYAQAYTVSVCAPLKKEDVFATFFFCVIAFSVNRRGFMASAVFGRIFNNNSVMSSWVQRMHLKYCNVTSNSLRKLW